MPSHADEQNELSPDGTTIRLELDMEEDIEREIHHFVKLSRMGLYSAAQAFFDQTLRKYDSFPPVIAEYADMLLEQGRYGHAARYLDDRLTVLEDNLDGDSKQLLRLMRSLANIQTKGALRSALVEANNAWELLDGYISTSDKPPDEIQVHTFELYANIVVEGYRTSDWVTERWMRCPFVPATSRAGNGFVQWFIILRDHGRLWEASRILRALIPIMPTLLASDLAELLRNPKSPSFQLSVPDRWASLVITMNQARFLLDSSLRVRVMDRKSPPVIDIHRMAGQKLDVAHQIWKSLPADQGVRPLYLPLALEKVCFDMAKPALSPFQLDDFLDALLELVSEADIRLDLQSEILARLYILLSNSEPEMDWRVLYSIFEIQSFDCESIIQHADTWEMFVSRFSNPKSPLRRPSQHPFLDLDRINLLLCNCTSATNTDMDLMGFLVSQKRFLGPIHRHPRDSRRFDCKSFYPVDMDIPIYINSFDIAFRFIYAYDLGRDPYRTPSLSITHSRICELQTLANHLELSETLTGTNSEDLLPEIEGLDLYSTKTPPGIDWVKLKEMEVSIRQRLATGGAGLDVDPPKTLQNVCFLGCFYTTQGWLKEASELYAYTLTCFPVSALSRPGIERNIPPTLLSNISNDLGRLYYIKGRLEKAEQPLVQALERKKGALPVEHRSTLNTMNNLGELYQEQGRLIEAEKVLEQAVEMAHLDLGLEHPPVLRTIKILSNIYHDQGKDMEANKLHGRVTAPEQEHPGGLDQPKSLIEEKGLPSSSGKAKEKSPGED